MSKRYTTTQAIEAIKTSGSVRQVLLKLGLVAAGGNYKTINLLIKKLSINTSHFHGQLWNKGKCIGPKYTISDYLENKRYISTHDLKRRLVREGFLEYKCSCCGITEWRKTKIALELDHIDGNNANNNLDNLRILCPNCHALTETYRGKNQVRHRNKK